VAIFHPDPWWGLMMKHQASPQWFPPLVEGLHEWRLEQPAEYNKADSACFASDWILKYESILRRKVNVIPY
jgi:hypothetical protein